VAFPKQQGISLVLFWCHDLFAFSVALCVLAPPFAQEKAGERKCKPDTFPAWHSAKRLSNLRQLHLFTLYLSWFCLAINFPRVFDVLGDFKTIPIVQILQNLVFLFYSYTPICLGFLVLHTVQWIVSARVDSFACRQG